MSPGEPPVPLPSVPDSAPPVPAPDDPAPTENETPTQTHFRVIRAPGPRGRSPANSPPPAAGPSRPRATSTHEAQPRASLEARGSGSPSAPARIPTPPWAGDSFSRRHTGDESHARKREAASREHEGRDRRRTADRRPAPDRERRNGGRYAEPEHRHEPPRLFLQYPVHAPPRAAHLPLQPPPPPPLGQSKTPPPPRLRPVGLAAPPQDVEAHPDALVSPPPQPRQADWQRDRDRDRARAREIEEDEMRRREDLARRYAQYRPHPSAGAAAPPPAPPVYPSFSRGYKRRRSASADTRRAVIRRVARSPSSSSGYSSSEDTSAPPHPLRSRARSPPHAAHPQRVPYPASSATQRSDSRRVSEGDAIQHSDSRRGSSGAFDHAVRIEHSPSPAPVSYGPPPAHMARPAPARRPGDYARTSHQQRQPYGQAAPPAYEPHPLLREHHYRQQEQQPVAGPSRRPRSPPDRAPPPSHMKRQRLDMERAERGPPRYPERAAREEPATHYARYARREEDADRDRMPPVRANGPIPASERRAPAPLPQQWEQWPGTPDIWVGEAPRAPVPVQVGARVDAPLGTGGLGQGTLLPPSAQARAQHPRGVSVSPPPPPPAHIGAGARRNTYPAPNIAPAPTHAGPPPPPSAPPPAPVPTVAYTHTTWTPHSHSRAAVPAGSAPLAHFQTSTAPGEHLLLDVTAVGGAQFVLKPTRTRGTGPAAYGAQGEFAGRVEGVGRQVAGYPVLPGMGVMSAGAPAGNRTMEVQMQTQLALGGTPRSGADVGVMRFNGWVGGAAAANGAAEGDPSAGGGELMNVLVVRRGRGAGNRDWEVDSSGVGGVQGVMKLGPPPVPKPPKPRAKRASRATGAPRVPRKGKARAVEVENTGADAWAHGGVTLIDGGYGAASGSAAPFRAFQLPTIESKPAFVRAARTPPARSVPRRGARGTEGAPLELSSDEEPRVKIEEDLEMDGVLDGPEESEVESEDEEYPSPGRRVGGEAHAHAGGVLVAVKTEEDDEDDEDELEYDELEDDADDFSGGRDFRRDGGGGSGAGGASGGGAGGPYDGPPDSASSAPSYDSADEAGGTGASRQSNGAYERGGAGTQEEPPPPPSSMSRPSSRASSRAASPHPSPHPPPPPPSHPSQSSSQLHWRIPTHTPGPSKRSAPIPDGTKRHPCDVCGQVFTRNGDVRRHKASRHSSAGVRCIYCGRVLTRQDALQRHWDRYCRKKAPPRAHAGTPMIMYAAPGSANALPPAGTAFGGRLMHTEDNDNAGKDVADDDDDQGEEGRSSRSRSGSPHSSAYGRRENEPDEVLAADEVRAPSQQREKSKANRGGKPRRVDRRWLVDRRAPTLRRMAKPTKFELEMAALRPGAAE
ncbi:hypothetical protein HYPSUDRAFT_52399 [Hypholoma sublateritium FD-334 SS-4]|uniref:C2H2-type domain-containing protein n=1 Tax=Hypholoma sublateritium (strain FD-334 SS-4) TaxID=945553 RepID=A0A0D2LFS7_HYPSF|nr:hypothetical protein HYPSUDRAFT_52399 [Hypholoma sublateritium FD-334 SS-4]